MSTILTNVYRGEQLESFHTGSIAVVDSVGRLLAFAGDPSLLTCMRSAAKPFQAIPFLEYGGRDEFDLTGEEMALICASHGGEPVHVATAAALLRKGDFDEDDLRCGAHAPFDEKSAADLRASGEHPSALHNNCSGKHSGMLLASKVMDAPSGNYTSADHPLQSVIRSTVGEFAGLGSDEIPVAIDGCGVPAFYLSLYRAAFAYARLMASAVDPVALGGLERYAESCEFVVGSMTSCPQFVAGHWSITTPLLEAFGGDLLAKEGAEGFYAMALSPTMRTELTERLRLTEDAALGIAMKIHDGSMGRGRNPAIIRTLELLGLDPSSRPQLQRYRDWPLRNLTGTLVGHVQAEFDLEFL
ncbi:MAG: asparaginase [Thermoanaerobaculia bacterium]